MLFDIIGIYISSLHSREEVFSILQRQKASLSKAFNDTHHGRSMAAIVLQYQKTLKQSIVDLHSLGYPIISFYVDHHLVHNISNLQHVSLANTFHTMKIIASEFAQTCLVYVSQRKMVKTLCGMVHLHNLHNMQLTNSVRYKQTIQVPHMFYIQVQFLEIILVGGSRITDCVLNQFSQVEHVTIFPFSANVQNWTVNFVFCGSHPPFTTIVSANALLLEAYFNIENTYASCKLRYSAIDILVSIKIYLASYYNYNYIN